MDSQTEATQTYPMPERGPQGWRFRAGIGKDGTDRGAGAQSGTGRRMDSAIHPPYYESHTLVQGGTGFMGETRVQRRLAAILAADVVGYSKLMEADEESTLRTLKSHREIIDGLIHHHDGRVFSTAGDSVVAEFRSAVEAVRAAMAIQQELGTRNEALPRHDKMLFRIGVNLGDIMVDGDDLLGDGVNVAARLEGLCAPGEVYVSGSVHDQVDGKLPLRFEDKGEHTVKNIAKPVQVYRLRAIAENAHGRTVSEGALPLPDKPSIAVLPFDNMSDDPTQEFLADGVVEAITAALSRIRSFFVIARNSAFTFKNRAVNVIEIGKELGVAYLLEGSVQRAGERIRITVQLVETEGGAHIWAEQYDGLVEDIFDLQDRITERVAGQLQPSIRLAEIERSNRKRPQDLSAYDLTMRAMPHVWALEKKEASRALALLDEALTIDPNYPLALSLAGWCLAQRSVYNWSETAENSRTQAFKLAEQAAQLSANDPLILTVLGAVHTFVRNFGTARVLLERALALDPNSAWAWQRLGWLDNYADQPEQALEKFEHALRLSPLDPMNFNVYVGMASANEIAQNYDKAVDLYRRALEERPQAEWILRNLVSSLSGADRMEEARECFESLRRAYPDLTIQKFRQAMVFSNAALDCMCTNLKKVGLPD